ncbi:ABC transporter substrate-binding protein [Nonomuraea jiangxiensis]|uniref:Polar amino acid transport system substrate-binding protein n=1 Tax=Nonomuraea jiangxiensis TaxID=633440 RepID=A0A1G9J589_9ACTN|nr:ABC transporter substrate-binding protein [Nonomuraea jiangxiensis]SDL32445.1 polar amino acid transport system substrate-binding protein [Nonomuraea jiangxiensis]
MKTRIVIPLLLASLAGTACGAQSLSADPSAPAGKSAAPAVLDQAPADDKAAAVINAIQPDPALTAKLPADIQSGGLKMTSSLGYPPMNMIGSDGKTAVGLDPSLGRAIARKLGVKLAITDEEFNSQIPGIITGRYDILMSSMSDTPERRTKVSFVDYVKAGAGMVVAKGNPEGIKTPADLCGKTISVVDNGSSLELAENTDAECEKNGEKGLEMLKFAGDQEALLQVNNGRAQANITDYVVAAYKASDPKTQVDALSIDGTEALWGIALRPDNKALIEAVRDAVNALIQSGEYGKILAAWDLDKLAIDAALINGAQ